MKIAWYSTYTGRQVNLLDLKEDDICLADIAHHLSQVNRFGGATRFPVSVAQHSFFVSQLCESEYTAQGLLHDASEAYLGDMTKWIKESELMSEYRRIEEQIQTMIFRKYGLPEKMHHSVEWADRMMCRYEASRSMTKFPAPGLEGKYGPIHPSELTHQQFFVLSYWKEMTAVEAAQMFTTQVRLSLGNVE